MNEGIIMQLIRCTVLIIAIMLYTTSIFAVTPQKIFDTVLWLTKTEENHPDKDQLKPIFLAKKNNSKLGLRIVGNALSCKSNELNKKSREYNLTCAAWHLVQHYLLLDIDRVKHENDEDCSICLSKIDKDILLHCGHQYCAFCLLQWFTKKPLMCEGVHRRCPICRSDIGENMENFLQSHADYQDLVFQNLSYDEQEDHQSLLDEQAALDRESIIYWFGEEAVLVQQAFDEHNQLPEEQNSQDEDQDALNLRVLADALKEALIEFINENYE